MGRRRSVTLANPLVLATLLAVAAGASAQPQSGTAGGSCSAAVAAAGCAAADSSQQTSPQPAPDPDAPGQPVASNELFGRIYGTVTDPDGNRIAGARVTLAAEVPGLRPGGPWPTGPRREILTDTTGSFQFTDVHSGTFWIGIHAAGFADWLGPAIVLSAGQYYEIPEITLQMATANTDVEVVLPPYEVAEEQVRAQEQQRILGVLPNFYTSYVWRAVPLTIGQKYRLALRSSIDPVTFGLDAVTAGIEQSQNAFSGYGRGAEGYAKRFGAAYADDAIGTFLGGAVFPSLLHQDPRYFYKGTGSIASRALYAVSTIILTRGDDGRRQPNYSNVLGNLAAAGISNLYYPSSDRNSAGVTIDNALISTGEGAISALLQEFVIKKLSRGVQHLSTDQTARGERH